LKPCLRAEDFRRPLCVNNLSSLPVWRVLGGCVAALALAVSGQSAVAASAPQQLQQTSAQLRAIAVTDDIPIQVPPSAIALQAQFKRDLQEAIVQALPDAPASQVDLAALQQSLSALAHSLAPSKNEPSTAQSLYGYVFDIQVSRPVGHADVLAVTASVRVPCGEDASLYLFGRQRGQWRTFLRVDSGAYARIDGAFGDLAFGLTPAAANGSYYVVAANINPWCSSNWQGLRYSVYHLQPGKRPRRVFARQESIYIGGELPVYTLRVGRSHFSLSFLTNGNVDEIVKKRTVRYSLSAGRVQGRRG